MTTLPSIGSRLHAAPTQRSSHAGLLGGSVRGAAVPSNGRVDAIVVPASRGADHVAQIVRLAARLRTPLVVLCSQETAGHEVAALVERETEASALIVDVPPGYGHPFLPAGTSAPRFRDASCGRRSDLALKRNLGLLLARLNSWQKIFFLDDDIAATGSGRQVVSERMMQHVAADLDRHQISGLSCREFPDNSVVCHARKLAGLPQENFVSGAALGVNCGDQPLPFFPDIYNEDWFFFSRRAAARELGYVGDVIQDPYDPYETPERARHEEFGDLLAEGLFALFEDQPAEMDYLRRIEAADAEYWLGFMSARKESLCDTRSELRRRLDAGAGHREQKVAGALVALDAAERQLDSLTPELCLDFLDTWISDLLRWERTTARISAVRDVQESSDVLSLQAATVTGPERASRSQRAWSSLSMRSSNRPRAVSSGCRSAATPSSWENPSCS